MHTNAEISIKENEPETSDFLGRQPDRRTSYPLTSLQQSAIRTRGLIKKPIV